jgi:hypothetical protein
MNEETGHAPVLELADIHASVLRLQPLPTQATFFLLRIDDPADGRPPDLQARNTDRGLSCMPLRKYKPRTAFPGVIGRTADRHRPDDRSAEFSMAAAAPFGCRPPGRGFERSYRFVSDHTSRRHTDLTSDNHRVEALVNGIWDRGTRHA